MLLVDDEPSDNMALTFTLESRGYQCITATNMKEGLAALSRYDVRVLVTDIMMPAGVGFDSVDASETGFHFISIVQENWPGLPIVCISVIGDQEKIQALIDKRVRYIRKGETLRSTAVEVITAVALGRRIRL